MIRFCTTVAALALATATQASTISISSFDATSYGALASNGTVLAAENFEGYSEGNVDDGFSTSVGTFSTLGGTGSGGTVTNADFSPNDGTKLAIRDGNVYGRVSTTQFLSGNPADDMFLDSNDTFGISWTASLGGTLFDQILLTLTDAADAGARMFVRNGADFSSFTSAGNGNRQTILISFDNAVSSAEILFESRYRHDDNLLRRNDGFSVDDIQLSAVPLPASLGFLLAGLAGMGVMSRRRKL